MAHESVVERSAGTGNARGEHLLQARGALDPELYGPCSAARRFSELPHPAQFPWTNPPGMLRTSSSSVAQQRDRRASANRTMTLAGRATRMCVLAVTMLIAPTLRRGSTPAT